MSSFQIYHFVEHFNSSQNEAREEWRFLNATDRVLYKNVSNYINKTGRQLLVPRRKDEVYYYYRALINTQRRRKPYADHKTICAEARECVADLSKTDKEKLRRKYKDIIEPKFELNVKQRRFVLSTYAAYLIVRADLSYTDQIHYNIQITTIFRKAMLLCTQPKAVIDKTMNEIVEWIDNRNNLHIA